MRRTVPPSAEIQASIDELLAKGMVNDPQKMLCEFARLGARLIIQREGPCRIRAPRYHRVSFGLRPPPPGLVLSIGHSAESERPMRN